MGFYGLLIKAAVVLRCFAVVQIHAEKKGNAHLFGVIINIAFVFRLNQMIFRSSRSSVRIIGKPGFNCAEQLQ